MIKSLGNEQNKIVWLSIIQGWAILLVVVGHVNLFTYSGTENEMYPAGALIHRFCYSFHMPLFMFISGGLLYLTRLKRGFTTKNLYKDKFKRLALPFIFFTLVGFAIKVPFSSFTKRGVDISVAGLFNSLWDPANGPLAELWFVATLIWLMLFYPLYVAAFKSIWTEFLLLAVSAIPLLFDLEMDIAGWLNFTDVFSFSFYFIGGMLFFKYDGVGFMEKRFWVTILLTALYFVLFFFYPVRLLISLLGILCSFGWGCAVARRFPTLFSSFRDSSFQIFLVGIFPQMLLELFVWKRFHAEWMIPLFYAVSCVAALYCGHLTVKIVQRVRWRQIRWLFGLK